MQKQKQAHQTTQMDRNTGKYISIFFVCALVVALREREIQNKRKQNSSKPTQSSYDWIC